MHSINKKKPYKMRLSKIGGLDWTFVNPMPRLDEVTLVTISNPESVEILKVPETKSSEKLMMIFILT